MNAVLNMDNLPLNDRTLAWVQLQAGESARCKYVKPLKGGISSAVYALDMETANGQTIQWVLRQFTDKEWLASEPDLAMHESKALQAAGVMGIAAPKWVAADVTGEYCGLPTVMMTRLPGNVVLPSNTPSEEWIRGLAEALAKLHHVGSENPPLDWNYFTYNELPKLQVPNWTKHPKAWSAVIERVQGNVPRYTPQLIHRDYHPANVLWQDGQVSGIVDWVNACTGPAGIDTAHCRLNLVQMYGVGAADAFLAKYMDCAGSVEDAADPYWDMLDLIEVLPGAPEVYRGWVDLGFTELNSELIARRLDEYAVILAGKI